MAEDMWADVDTYYGKAAKAKLNFFAYQLELERRKVPNKIFSNLVLSEEKTNERFKNSPLYNKCAIMKLMDELTPDQMVKMVDYLQGLVKNIVIQSEFRK